MKGIHMIAFILLVVGGLNWLLVGIFGWDISRWLGGQEAIVPKIVYILVGLAALLEIFTHKKNCCACTESKAPVAPVRPMQ